MKKINYPRLVLFALLVLVNINCKKDIIGSPPQTNSAPVVNAGTDIRLEIPLTHTLLTGTANDANGNIEEYNWRKIAGPGSYLLEWSNKLSSKLIWLEEGDYEFELTATDKEGLTDRDTVKVNVFSNLKKHVLYNLTPNASGFSVAQISPEVINNIKWVYGKSGRICEQADAGPHPNIDYGWGGYYYELLSGNIISVFGGYTGYNVDVIIYY